MIPAIVAAILLIVGSFAVYLASPHQKLRPSPAPHGAAIMGAVAIAAALIILLTIMGPATAVFAIFIGLMFMWSIPPVAIAWFRYRQGGNR